MPEVIEMQTEEPRLGVITQEETQTIHDMTDEELDRDIAIDQGDIDPETEAGAEEEAPKAEEGDAAEKDKKVEAKEELKDDTAKTEDETAKPEEGEGEGTEELSLEDKFTRMQEQLTEQQKKYDRGQTELGELRKQAKLREDQEFARLQQQPLETQLSEDELKAKFYEDPLEATRLMQQQESDRVARESQLRMHRETQIVTQNKEYVKKFIDDNTKGL